MAIITISRGSKSGGQALAERLAQQLHYQYLISREVLIKAAETYGVNIENLRDAMQDPPDFLERLDARNPRRMYLKLIRATLLDYAKSGSLIYHGYAGQFLLQDVTWALKVRLILPLPQRVALVQESLKLTRSEAEQYIHKVDEDRLRWGRFLYQADWSDPANYDVVLNLRSISLDSACNLLGQLLNNPAFTPTPERLAEIQDLALAARVEAAIEIDPNTQGHDLSATSKNSVVHLRGVLEQTSLRPRILEIARQVPGVTEVRDEIAAVP